MSQQQASTPVSPLRRRMLDDMAMRGLHEDTQRNYIMSVRNFAAFLGRSPETATPEDVRRFQIHQADSGVQPSTVNNAVSGLRFLFNVTLDRPDLSRRRTRPVSTAGQGCRVRAVPPSASGRLGQDCTGSAGLPVPGQQLVEALRGVVRQAGK
ncbi:hypothetical protein D3273_19725, partial [Lichenibacterium minor]